MFVNVTIPVLNEEVQLPHTVRSVQFYLSQCKAFTFEIVLANNGSTDRTQALADELAREFSTVRAVHIPSRGRGGAIKKVWRESDADILSYIDCDLSTDLSYFPPLIEALAIGGYDLAIGSRLRHAHLTTRSLKREVISRGYNLLIKFLFRASFSDAQCGFKAITRQAGKVLLPLVKDDGWFMDTELLLIAERLGYSVCDLPVRWIDDTDSRVNIFDTAVRDLCGLVRLRRDFLLGKSLKAGSDLRKDSPPVETNFGGREPSLPERNRLAGLRKDPLH